MEQYHDNTKSRKGKHLKYEEREKIEILIRAGHGTKEIANLIGCSERTIRREKQRGKVELLNSDLTTRTEYSPDAAQRQYDIKAHNKGRTLKIGNDHALVAYIESRIRDDKYSPYAALQKARNERIRFKSMICLRTLYNYIDMGLFLHISNKDLPREGKGKRHKYHKINRRAYNNRTGKLINERDESILDRTDFGHWELDTVVGRNRTRTVLLVLTERKTRYEKIFKLENKTEGAVVRVLDELEQKLGTRRFKKVFKTITCDNGCENLDYESMERSIKRGQRTTVFYTHPYSAWERGSNENANKLIRRFVPKGTDIGQYKKSDIKRIEHWMNSYPRKILNGKTAYMAVEELNKAFVI